MHAVVTGASTGIGEALARELSRAGADVTLVARRAEQLERLAGELTTRTHRVVRDLAERGAVDDWLPAAEAALGPVDVLVNNAGVQFIEPTAKMDVERGEQLLAVNLATPLRLIRTVLPGMLARGRGTVVNICSMAALAPTPGMTYYNASKAGLAASSEAMAGELAPLGIHVVTVYPGIIDTAMAERGLVAYDPSLALRMQPHGSPEVLARRVRRAVERRRRRVIYPRLNVLARWFPGTTRWVMDRFSPPLRGE